jgi:hypothetical protein
MSVRAPLVEPNASTGGPVRSRGDPSAVGRDRGLSIVGHVTNGIRQRARSPADGRHLPQLTRQIDHEAGAVRRHIEVQRRRLA